jgi:selenocysteine lyase/cysteine desulfurase
MGPKEVGVLYVRQERIPAIWPGVVSAGWNANALQGKSASAKFEQLGQRDDAALAAVGTMVDFHQMIGAANVEARTTALATALKDGLAKLPNVKVSTPMDPALSGGVVIANVPAFDRAKMSALVRDLYDKYGIAAAGTGGLRLSPHTYNTMADVELAIRAVKELTA